MIAGDHGTRPGPGTAAVGGAGGNAMLHAAEHRCSGTGNQPQSGTGLDRTADIGCPRPQAALRVAAAPARLRDRRKRSL